MLVVLPAVGGGLLGLGLMASGFSVSSGGSTDLLSSFGPRHLKPIAIPKAACPSLNVVRIASSKAEAYWNGRDAFTSLGTPAADKQLDALLAPLDYSVRVAATQVPARLAGELSDVSSQVEIGRALIAYRQTESPHFIDALGAGVHSLSNASDLVGTACGLPLADVSL